MPPFSHLTEIQLEALHHGKAQPAELRHYFLCPACRGRLILLSESLREGREATVTHRSLALAAAGAQLTALRSLYTADETLACRLEVDERHGGLLVTVLAEQKQWGEFVVIWPGAGDPIIAEVGRPTPVSEQAAAIGNWIVSRAEVRWSGHGEQLPDRIDGEYNSILVERDRALRLSYTEPALSLTLLREAGVWRPLKLPAVLTPSGEITLTLYTPLSAFELK